MQAGGQEFDPPQLHQFFETNKKLVDAAASVKWPDKGHSERGATTLRNSGYSKEIKRNASREECEGKELLNISGTEARKMLKEKILPPEWFMYPDISELIINKLSNGEKVFI